ncbi:MAG: universal stress protein [Syntrophobacteraceae bacterium]
MERFLIALDCLPGCLKIVDYMLRVLKGSQSCEFMFFHVLPTTSPDKLRKEEVHRIEFLHANRQDLAGYFWRDEDEKSMARQFDQARETLALGGFPGDRVSFHFSVESGDIAALILSKAAELKCPTIVLGRRRLSRVKEFLLGSTSSTVLRMARGSAVWVIEFK